MPNVVFKLILLFMLSSFQGICQLHPSFIQRFLETGNNQFSVRMPEIGKFYTAMDHQAAWMPPGDQASRESLLQLIDQSITLGLNKEDYKYSTLITYHTSPLPGIEDSLRAEITFTDAAIHFFTDIAYGNARPDLRYHGLEYNSRSIDIPQLLVQFVRGRSLPMLVGRLEPPMPVIDSICKRLAKLHQIRSDSLSREERVVSTTISHTNTPLIKKLYYLGIADSIVKKSDTNLKSYVVEAQKRFNLLSDGVMRSTLLQELNVPVATRLRQLSLALNYYRWLYHITLLETVIVVNIPAAYMTVYDASGIKLEMKMVVGKYSTPTPTLSSRISEVILYPYWHVPKSIIFNELLPAIKRNPGFIDYNNFQVINNQGKIVDPYNINWNLLNRSNFPYIIRQSTGCDNSLGMLKLNFYSPFGVYLHDTPLKSMFMVTKRYFSHGCMRMEKPLELGKLIIPANAGAIDTLEEKGCVINEKPIIFPAENRMPVIVWYNPVGIDARGEIVFFEDVYRKFKTR